MSELGPPSLYAEIVDLRHELWAERKRRASVERELRAAEQCVKALRNFVQMGETYGWDSFTTGRQIFMADARTALSAYESARESK